MLAGGDLHWTRTPPGTRAPSYSREIDELMTELYDTAALYRADAVALAGDILHSKGNTTHAEVAELGHIFRREQARTMVPRTLAIPGNHDMQGNNVLNAQQDQPYAVLTQTGCFEDISARTSPEIFSPFEVAVHGIPFGAGLNPPIIAKLTNAAITGRGGCLVLMTHHELSTDGSVGSSGPKFVQSLMLHLGRPVVVINGHLHLEPAIVPVATNGLNGMADPIAGYFVQIGTMARTSPGDSDTAAACLVDFDFSRPRNMQLGVQLLKLHNLPRFQAFVPDAPTIESDSNMDAFIASLKVDEESGLDPADLVRQAATHRSPAPRPAALERAVQLVGECR